MGTDIYLGWKGMKKEDHDNKLLVFQLMPDVKVTCVLLLVCQMKMHC